MSLDQDIVSYLEGEGIERVYPVRLPEKVTLPAVVYQRISTRRLRSHEGTSLVGPLYQFTCWANRPADAKDLARQVIDAWEARMGFALVEDDREGSEPTGKLFRRDVDVRLWAGLDDETAPVSS